jgi:hypothetical protein
MILYHYCCAHSAAKITETGSLIPSAHPHLPQIAPIVWLTDMRIVGEAMDVERLALGMPHNVAAEEQGCDRFSHRVTVAERGGVFRWPRWARRNLNPRQQEAIEINNPGIMTAHWWLAFRPMAVLAVQETAEPLIWVAHDPDASLADSLAVLMEATR